MWCCAVYFLSGLTSSSSSRSPSSSSSSSSESFMSWLSRSRFMSSFLLLEWGGEVTSPGSVLTLFPSVGTRLTDKTTLPSFFPDLCEPWDLISYLTSCCGPSPSAPDSPEDRPLCSLSGSALVWWSAARPPSLRRELHLLRLVSLWQHNGLKDLGTNWLWTTRSSGCSWWRRRSCSWFCGCCLLRSCWLWDASRGSRPGTRGEGEQAHGTGTSTFCRRNHIFINRNKSF